MRNKYILIYILILTFICSTFLGCSGISINPTTNQTVTPTLSPKMINTPIPRTTTSQTATPMPTYTHPASNMDLWIGAYGFSEYYPPDKNMFYGILIYKEEGEYYAKIDVNGWMTLKRLQAKVIGNEKSIKIIFDKYLPNNQFEPYKSGDDLLSFEKRDSVIYTSWGKYEPMLLSNKEPGVYFKPVPIVSSNPAQHN